MGGTKERRGQRCGKKLDKNGKCKTCEKAEVIKRKKALEEEARVKQQELDSKIDAEFESLMDHHQIQEKYAQAVQNEIDRLYNIKIAEMERVKTYLEQLRIRALQDLEDYFVSHMTMMRIEFCHYYRMNSLQSFGDPWQKLTRDVQSSILVPQLPQWANDINPSPPPDPSPPISSPHSSIVPSNNVPSNNVSSNSYTRQKDKDVEGRRMEISEEMLSHVRQNLKKIRTDEKRQDDPSQSQNSDKSTI